MSSSIKEIEAIKVLVGPHMTEKSYGDTGEVENYVFKILPSATKADVKIAIEKLFNVKVKSVNTLNVKGKAKSFKQKLGKRKNWKKAYVHLQDGFELDFVGAVDKG